jgi:hypothetical protein
MTVDPKNLGTYLSAIRNFHLALKLPWVDIRDRYRVGWCLKGLRRLVSTQVCRKLPITPELLVKTRLCASIEWGNPRMVVLCHVVSFLHDVSQGQLLREKDRRMQRASALDAW